MATAVLLDDRPLEITADGFPAARLGLEPYFLPTLACNYLFRDRLYKIALRGICGCVEVR